MKTFSVTMIALAAHFTLANGVLAADLKGAESLAKASGCLACHSIDKKIVGPAYKDVALKYRNDKSAQNKLVKKVKAGGKGVWGNDMMPPNAHVKDQDITTIVQWILTIR